MKSKFKRIGTDIGGYGLVLLGIATGWLPGPGGIPLVLAGLGLLSIHNAWARRLRDLLTKYSGKAAKILFPDNRWIKLAYDFATVILCIIAFLLILRHAAVWQISLSIFLLFFALLILSFNRQRLARLRHKA